jgi:hypothetical protein
MQFCLPDDIPPHRLTLEPYKPFIQYLAKNVWSASMDCPARIEAESASEPANPSFSSQMVQSLGAGPALVVFAWLRNCLFSAKDTDHTFVRRTTHGLLCIAATQAEIAEQTGLSDPQVKRGLDTLRKRAAIVVKRAEGGNLIWLNQDFLRALDR